MPQRPYRRRSLLILTSLLPLLIGAAAPGDAFDSLVAAERGFAADAARIGITRAFRDHAASDGVLFRPEPMPAADALARQEDSPGVTLEWQPALAAIARSNDLGFTTGPYRIVAGSRIARGQFLTVWRRDHDGRWRWIVDHGLPPVAGDLAAALPRTVRRIAPAAKRSIQRPAPDLAQVDDQLNIDMIAQGPIAIAAMMAADGRLLRAGIDPVEEAAVRMQLAREAPVRSATRLSLHQSAAGDLAITYGRIGRAVANGNAHYVRIWQRRETGWRILVDEVTPAPAS